VENLIKSSYAQSYPHYPQERYVEYLIYKNREKTDVLVNNHEFAFFDKKVKKSIDFFNVKIQVNIL
jgi:hypothetical protein